LILGGKALLQKMEHKRRRGKKKKTETERELKKFGFCFFFFFRKHRYMTTCLEKYQSFFPGHLQTAMRGPFFRLRRRQECPEARVDPCHPVLQNNSPL
jgi:hypothetical protein